MLTEGHGVPIGVVIEGAQRHDMKLVRSIIQSIIVERPNPTEEHPQGMCLDKGYDYDEVYAIVQEFGFTAHVRSRGEEAKSLKREAGFKARVLWWWSEHIPGRTAFAVCSSGGRKSRKTPWPCSISLAAWWLCGPLEFLPRSEGREGEEGYVD